MKILCCIITGLFGRIFYFWQWWIQFGKPSSLRNVLWIISGQGVQNFDREFFYELQIYLNIKKQEMINQKIEFSHNPILHTIPWLNLSCKIWDEFWNSRLIGFQMEEKVGRKKRFTDIFWSNSFHHHQHFLSYLTTKEMPLKNFFIYAFWALLRASYASYGDIIIKH